MATLRMSSRRTRCSVFLSVWVIVFKTCILLTYNSPKHNKTGRLESPGEYDDVLTDILSFHCIPLRGVRQALGLRHVTPQRYPGQRDRRPCSTSDLYYSKP